MGITQGFRVNDSLDPGNPHWKTNNGASRTYFAKHKEPHTLLPFCFFFNLILPFPQTCQQSKDGHNLGKTKEAQHLFCCVLFADEVRRGMRHRSEMQQMTCGRIGMEEERVCGQH